MEVRLGEGLCDNPVIEKFRWTARGRRWGSTPCSRRTSSIFHVKTLSKCQQPGWTNSVHEEPNASLPCRQGHGETVQHFSC